PINPITGSKATVYEAIAFGLENFGVPKEEMEVRIEDSLRLLDIEEYRDRAPFDLSGGQMQRMEIAIIMAMKPEVIILDEPTSQL
ncbi:ATP-binding cassette domain-containing protein, partial [Streptococcus suis]